MLEKENDLKVSLRLLPSQTEAAFLIIILVILGTIIASSIGASPVILWPVALSILIFPIRSFLASPQKDLNTVDQVATDRLIADDILPCLQHEIEQLVQEIGYRQPVHLLISARPQEARAFGTWRQHYVLLGESIARELHRDLQEPQQRPKAQALLTHELGHHLHKDVQRIGYTRLLLRDSFIILGWWALFLIGLLILSFQAMPGLLALNLTTIPIIDPNISTMLADTLSLSPVERTQITEKLNTFSIGLLVNFLVYTFLPITFIGGVLWLFYWRRMVRLQEHYADLLSAETLKGTDVLILAFGRYPAWFRPAESPGTSAARTIRHPLRQRSAQAANFSWSGRSQKNWRLFALHPTYHERFNSLKNPLILHRDWPREALAITVLVVALEILLISPAAGYFLSGFPVHFVSITVLVLTSTWALPLMANGRPFFGGLAKMLLVVFAVRGLWIMFNILLLVGMVLLAPQWASGGLNSLVIALSRVASEPQTLPINDIGELILWLPGYIALQLTPILAVSIGLLLYYLANRSSFTSANPQEVRWHRQHWRSLIIISAALILLLLTPVTTIYYNNPSSLLVPWRLLSYFFGIILLIVLWRFNKRSH